VSTGLRAAVVDGRVPGVYDGAPDALRPLDTTAAAPRQRPHAQAALDAGAPVTLRSGGQVLPAPCEREAPRRVLGTRRAIEQVLTACGWTINTAFVERLNRDLRQRVAALRRRSATSCKGADGLGQQLVLFQVYHNFVLPHASLRQALAEAVPTHGQGSAKVWRPWTPAMAAGLTDHVWSLREVLCYRVPPWPQP
jgi:hypothetical protein